MGNGLTYSRYMSEYSRHIDLVVRLSTQIYGIFQEYVRISNFYGFQMVGVWRKVTGNASAY